MFHEVRSYSQGKALIGTLIADIVLQLLSYVAQTERDFIHNRQAEGIVAAKARGVRFGPKPQERPPSYPFFLQEWRSGRLSARQAGKPLGASHETFIKWVNSDTVIFNKL